MRVSPPRLIMRVVADLLPPALRQFQVWQAPVPHGELRTTADRGSGLRPGRERSNYIQAFFSKYDKSCTRACSC